MNTFECLLEYSFQDKAVGPPPSSSGPSVPHGGQ